MPKSFAETYRAAFARRGFTVDPGQARALEALAALAGELEEPKRKLRSSRAMSRLRRRLALLHRSHPIRGLYLWGGVGRGKTLLMDLFYDSLPFQDRRRLHFHHFMSHVHRDLKALSGTSNPLEAVASSIAAETSVLCFDEFLVEDIADAMLLGGLLAGLFSRGVCLVATSNTRPAELYREGLQRSRFLPAIALLEEHVQVLHLATGADYRLRTLEQASIYHCPLDESAQRALARYFADLSAGLERPQPTLEVCGRQLEARKLAGNVAWFDFAELCDAPRSSADYIELARRFHTLLVEGVPCFHDRDDQARRFISLVDELYERRVKLVLSAAVPLAELYSRGRLGAAFERCRSRLLEMQSHDYLAASHRP